MKAADGCDVESMTRFLPLALSTATGPHDVPIPGPVEYVDTDQMERVEGVIVDNRWRAFVDDCVPACHATVHATIAGREHVIVVGQFEDLDQAIEETERFSQWLVGVSLLDAGPPQFYDPVDAQPGPALSGRRRHERQLSDAAAAQLVDESALPDIDTLKRDSRQL